MEENGEDSHGIQAEEDVPESKEANGAEKATEADDSAEPRVEADETADDGGAENEQKLKGRGRGRRKTSKPDTEAQADDRIETAGKKRQRKEPLTPTVERPARERKSIDRFAASVEKEKVKPFKIEKGAGTSLKDIPNVVFKLSKRKGTDEALQLLHKLLYGKRMKPHHVKPNILQFSGYVWSNNQDKEKAKVKERLDKYVKESLLQMSDILDLNFPRATSKKEDVVVKLLEFLEAPYRTTDTLLEEKEQKLKVKKRKKMPNKGTRKKASEQTPRKRQKHEGKPSREELSAEEEEEEAGGGYDEDVEEKSEEEPVKKKQRSKANVDDESAKKSRTPKMKGRKPSKEKTTEDEVDIEAKSTKPKVASKMSKKKIPALTKAPVRSPSRGSKKKQSDSSKVFSRKKKKEEQDEEDPPKTEKAIKGRGSSQSNAKEESKPKIKVQASKPSDEELRAAICELLQDADFSTVTFTDVVKLLGKKFNADFSENKAHVKILIQEEISKIVDEDDGEGEDDNGGEEDTEKGNEKSDLGGEAD